VDGKTERNRSKTSDASNPSFQDSSDLTGYECGSKGDPVCESLRSSKKVLLLYLPIPRLGFGFMYIHLREIGGME